MALLRFSDITGGSQEATLDLGVLYPDAAARNAFEARWEAFFASDASHPAILTRSGNSLAYQTIFYVPTQRDTRPPLLFLMGNPASHSAAAGYAFAFEARRRRHRFWAQLAEAGFVDFALPPPTEAQEVEQRNAILKARFLSLDYTSPFRLAITPIISLPSTASRPPWSGVGGVRKLFGSRAFQQLLDAEAERVRRTVELFLAGRGAMLAFQKDAYEAVRPPHAPPYALTEARTFAIRTHYRHDPAIALRVGPPTRFWTGQGFQVGMRALRDELASCLSGEGTNL